MHLFSVVRWLWYTNQLSRGSFQINLYHRHLVARSIPSHELGSTTSEVSNELVVSTKRYKLLVIGMFIVYIILLFCRIPYLGTILWS